MMADWLISWLDLGRKGEYPSLLFVRLITMPFHIKFALERTRSSFGGQTCAPVRWQFATGSTSHVLMDMRPSAWLVWLLFSDD